MFFCIVEIHETLCMKTYFPKISIKYTLHGFVIRDTWAEFMIIADRTHFLMSFFEVSDKCEYRKNIKCFVDFSLNLISCIEIIQVSFLLYVIGYDFLYMLPRMM